MCAILVIKGTGIVIETLGALRKVMPLGLEPPGDSEDCCLCPVDLEAVGQANGYRVYQDWQTEWAAGDYIAEKEKRDEQQP